MARLTPRPVPTEMQTLKPLLRSCPTCGETLWAAYHNYRTITTLEASLDAAVAGQPRPGRRMLHRLHRAENANAVRDLLGLEVDVASLLPPDDAAFGLDNVADAPAGGPARQQA